MSELERLRQRAAAREADVHEASVALEAAKAAFDKAQQAVDAKAQGLATARTRRRATILVLVLVVLPVMGVAASIPLRYVEPERLTLEVRDVSGAAPARLGEVCVLQAQPAYFPYNALLKLTCGGQRIYGFGSFGQLHCDVVDQQVTSCLDDNDIQHGGDPRLRLDRSVGRMTLDDGAHWRIELGFTP